MTLPGFFRLLAAVPVCGLAVTLAQAAEDAPSKEGIEFFETRIRPVLATKCYKCHAADSEKIKGGLLLDTRQATRQGGDTGPGVVPGDPGKSLVLTAIRYEDEDLEMPPKEKLPENVIADFEKWIAMGAPDPRDGGSALTTTINLEEGRKHWSFQPIANPPVPEVKDKAWPRTPIDRFVLAGLEAKGLHPVGDATPEELRRRVAIDLTGLPPQETESSNLESQVATLLASPQFGERWGRHWLDVARYAESAGASVNVPFPLAFRYRDWVIDSLNADKPYDQFIREQLAGDLLPFESDAQRNSQVIATGFLTVGLKDLKEREQKRFRMAMADEQIDATTRGFLGLTVACAKCHDHKFDPIPTADYYALAGIFRSSEPMLGVRRNRIADPFGTGIIPFAGQPAGFTEEDQRELIKLYAARNQTGVALRDEKVRVLRERGVSQKKRQKEDPTVDAEPGVQKAKAAADKVIARLAEVRGRYGDALRHSAMGMREAEPADCAIHIRGEDSQLGPEVPRGFLRVLTTAETKPINRGQSGRLELAEWIASERNPLTARVMVNRVWQHLFGAGLVETPDDFGKTGQPPSDPALLDFLASRFIAQGWSIKTLIRDIMSSRVYQLSTAHDAAAYEADPANRLHWRMNRRRLDSDALLDSIRAVSGELATGRPAPQYALAEYDDRVKSMDLKAWFAPTAKHRTVYQPVLRDRIPDEWSLFDFPVPELVTGRRSITTVPTQALFLMNSPFIVEHSRKTAARILKGTREREDAIRDAFTLILNRRATAEEIAGCAALVQNLSTAAEAPAALATVCQALFASAEFRNLY